MKSIIVAVLALTLGLLVGAWGPRSDLRATRNQVKELKMDSVLPEGWRENTTPDTEPINFIDPTVASPFLELDPGMFDDGGGNEDGDL